MPEAFDEPLGVVALDELADDAPRVSEARELVDVDALPHKSSARIPTVHAFSSTAVSSAKRATRLPCAGMQPTSRCFGLSSSS